MKGLKAPHDGDTMREDRVGMWGGGGSIVGIEAETEIGTEIEIWEGRRGMVEIEVGIVVGIVRKKGGGVVEVGVRVERGGGGIAGAGVGSGGGIEEMGGDGSVL